MTRFQDYAKWTETTVVYPTADPDLAMSYVTIGLLSEVGEVASLVKRSIRDGETFSDNGPARDAMIAELGDCAWYLARIAELNGATHLIEEPSGTLFVLGSPEELFSTYLVEIVRQLPRVRAANLNLIDTLRPEYKILQMLSLMAEAVGASMGEVFGRNRAKLTARQERGVLHGKGGER